MNLRMGLGLDRHVMAQGAGIIKPGLDSAYFWLEADVVTQSGGFVTTWDDQSSNGRDFQEIGSPGGPPYRASGANGEPDLNFSGDNYTLDGQGYVPTGNFTIYQITTLPADITLSNNNNYLLGFRGVNDFWRVSTSGAARVRLGGITTDTAAGILTSGQTVLFTTVFNGASSSFRIDGTEILTPDYSGAATLATDWFLGRRTASDFYEGQISAFILIEETTVNTELETYLIEKYIP